MRVSPPGGSASPIRQYGLIAEEVAEVNPGLVQFGKDGKPLAVRYHFVGAMLLNEAALELQLGVALRLEDLFDGYAEEACETEGQRQARIVPAGFDRIDGLARDAEPLGDLSLRPVALRPQHAKAVRQAALLPEYRRVPSQEPAPQESIMTTAVACRSSSGAPSRSSSG